MSPPLLLRALSLAGRKAACPPRPHDLVMLTGAHGAIRATTIPPPSLLRALSSRAGEVEPRPRPRPEEITISGGGADLVSPTAAASGGDARPAPWLIGAAGASATINLESDPVAPATAREDSALLCARHLLNKVQVQAEQHHLAARDGYGEGEDGSFNPRPRVAAALVCLVANHNDLPAIQSPEFVVLEADDNMVELIRELIVAGGGHPEHGETTGGFVSLAPCVCDDVRDKKILPSSGITNVSSLAAAAATANGINIMIPAQSASGGSRGRLLSMQTTRCLSSTPNVSSPDDTSNDGKRKAKRIKLVDVSVRVTELEQLVRSFDKRLEHMEAKWEANLRIAEMRADIAEKRADQLEKLLEKTVEGMERMVLNKMDRAITWVMYKNCQQEELSNSQHSFLLRLYTQLAQDMAKTTK